MKYKNKKEAKLVLEDGTVFFGNAVGKIGVATGEICFNTGMTGYQEIFTDPSYFGQIMLTTNAHIGNYGIHNEEVESDSTKISGLICKNFNELYSRVDADMSIQDYFESENLVGISDVDTRALVRHIRDKGAMNGIISSDNLDVDYLQQKLKEVPSMEGLQLCDKVSTKSPYYFGDENADIKIAVLDLGVKKNILRCLADRGCYLKVFPWNTSYEDMKAWNPDGFFLSNGPGDPSMMPNVILNVKKITDTAIPTFGICLGHQALALSEGIKTFKMHNGHRGINHPVKNLETGKCEVTSQNHGFGIIAKDVYDHPVVEVTHVNLNDDTIEGIKIESKNAFSVQYHPESSPGPHDSRYLFDQFINLINTNKNE
ncbi:MAG: glutamine-hydrolyzing carbamoyl-phosphate synthase small subunit [Flavobacteriales bacterium]